MGLSFYWEHDRETEGKVGSVFRVQTFIIFCFMEEIIYYILYMPKHYGKYTKNVTTYKKHETGNKKGG